MLLVKEFQLIFISNKKKFCIGKDHPGMIYISLDSENNQIVIIYFNNYSL